jgi:hypothetical protein
LRRAAKGPRQVDVPLIDIGTLGSIEDGSIKILGSVERFTLDGVDTMTENILCRHSRDRLPGPYLRR